MSTGARDQLDLALRLAYLEDYEKAEPNRLRSSAIIFLRPSMKIGQHTGSLLWRAIGHLVHPSSSLTIGHVAEIARGKVGR